MSVQGGQGELHQLLTLEAHSVSDPRATEDQGQASIERLTKVFRLLGNELAILVSTVDHRPAARERPARVG